MTDRLIRQAVIVSATLAVLAVLFEAPAFARVPIVIGFALIAPGLAVSRFVPTLSGVDRIALAAATSLALTILTSLLLVALGQWRGAPVLVVLALLSLVFAVTPLQTPWRRRTERRTRLRNEQIRDRRRAQARAYEQVQSPSAGERRDGLLALSWLLEEDDRPDEAARLRSLARLGTPPRLTLGDHVLADADLQLVHQRARSEDPETRRRGLFEVADLLNEAWHGDDAAALREVADRDEL